MRTAIIIALALAATSAMAQPARPLPVLGAYVRAAHSLL
jgi:hypothetical protein